MAQTTHSLTIESAVSGLVIGFARHWLAIFNSLWGLYILLPLLAPILLHFGFNTSARVIYSVYSFACHQLPDHSYFFFSETFIPHVHELEAGGMKAGLHLMEQRHFIGNEIFGYKAAICQRDIAIYGSVFLGGLFFNFARHRLRPLNWMLFLLFLVPIGLDGTTQLFGLRESNWWLRTLTGALFGLAAVWIAYPHVETAMQEVIEEESVLKELRQRSQQKT